MEILNHVLGLDQDKLTWYQMTLRAGIVFFAALTYIRLAGMRTFGKKTAFDLVIGLILGGILGKAIIGREPFFPILCGALCLVLLHRFIAWITYRNKTLERIIKGNPLLVVHDGKCIDKNLAKANMTHRELMEALHINGNISSLEEVKEAYFEMNGEISIVPKDK